MPVRRPRRKPGAQLGEDVARSMIVAGAARVFAQKGIRDASVEDLLDASKVSRRTFYRMFDSKEDVALALYTFGTNGLVESWKRAIATTTDPLEQFARCIDAHLKNAASVGRLVFVLGGEASRQESPLHKRRMEVHDQLVELFRAANPKIAKLDPLLVRSTIFALEAVTRKVLEDGDEGRKVSPAEIARARRVMERLVTAGFAGEGPGVAPLPLA
ncbi:MAG: TetR/AcrR family transcriptional regulator [Acidobacteriota bacterium]